MMDRDALRAQLIRHEGLRLSAYTDSLGYWTIGVGRLIDPRMGGGLSHDEAMLLLDNDIDECVADLTAQFPWYEELDDIRQRAVTDLRFNLGSQGLSGFKHFLAWMARANYERAAESLINSKWYGQVGTRAERIVHMVRTGQ